MNNVIQTGTVSAAITRAMEETAATVADLAKLGEIINHNDGAIRATIEQKEHNLSVVFDTVVDMVHEALAQSEDVTLYAQELEDHILHVEEGVVLLADAVDENFARMEAHYNARISKLEAQVAALINPTPPASPAADKRADKRADNRAAELIAMMQAVGNIVQFPQQRKIAS